MDKVLTGVFIIVLVTSVVQEVRTEFTDSPPPDIVVVAGQRVELKWTFAQEKQENVVIAFAKHGPHVLEYQIECVNRSESDLICYNSTGVVTIVISSVTPEHDGRYDMAITNGAKDDKYFNLHVVGLHVDVFDGSGNSFKDKVMDKYEYNLINYPQIVFNEGEEYAFKIHTSLRPVNVSCVQNHNGKRRYDVTRLDTEEVLVYHMYASSRLINEQLHLECALEIGLDIPPLILQQEIVVIKRTTEDGVETSRELPMNSKHLPGFIYGSVSVLVVISVISLVIHVISVIRFRKYEYARVDNPMSASESPDLISVMTDLKSTITQFGHLNEPVTKRALAIISNIVSRRERHLSIESTEDSTM